MTHGSLFSGIGGFDLAAEWMGWDNLFHCEWNLFGQKVLKHYWPNAESFNDITKTDFIRYANKIDVLTGGFPCQPYSLAGKRKGKEDERHLWPEMLRAIKEIQPRWVVGENVFGLVNWNGGLVFHEVQIDLEAAGYEVFPYVLPAAAVNAPHRRDRIWFVAYRNSSRSRQEHELCAGRNLPKERIDKCGDAADTHRNGFKRSDCENEINASERRLNALGNIEQMGRDADDTKSQRSRQQSSADSGRSNGRFNDLGETGDAADTCNEGLQGSEINGGIGAIGEERNQFFIGCFPSIWDKFPTQSPICSRNDGLSSRLDGITFSKWRNESIKAAGNAIVPQVVFQIFQAIKLYELQNQTITTKQ